MIAASMAYLDGLSILGGQNCYWTYHHRLCHNLPFGVIGSLLLAAFSGRRAGIFLLYLVLFHLHLHLNMDIFGSGPHWGIYYLWPFSNYLVDNTDVSWAYYSWQNLTIAGALIAWTVVIAIKKRRTPLEALMPELDRKLVRWLRREPV